MESSTETSKDIFKTVQRTNQPFKITKNNDIIYEEQDLKIKTYRSKFKGKNASNDSSTITLLSYKDFDMLFMGDAGVKSFNKVKNLVPHNIEVLKSGHHGGPSSR